MQQLNEPQFDQSQWSDYQTKALEEQASIKSFRSTAGRCAGIVIIIAIFMNLFAFGAMFLLDMLTSRGVIEISAGLKTVLGGYLPVVPANLAAILLGVVLLKPKLKQAFVKPTETKSFIVIGVLSSIATTTIGAQLYLQIETALQGLGYQFSLSSLMQVEHSGTSLIISLVYVCLFAPFLEEVIFRGVILRALAPYGKMSAIIISAVLFGLSHMNPVQLPLAILSGLLFGYMTIRSGSIWPAILGHIFNNTVASVGEITNYFNIAMLTNMLMLVLQFISIAASILLLVFAYRYGRGFTSLLKEEDSSLVKTGKHLLHAASTPTGILLILGYVGMCVLLIIGVMLI